MCSLPAGRVHCQIVGVQTVEKKEPWAIKRAIEKTLERNLQLRLSNQDWAKKLVGFEAMELQVQREKTAAQWPCLRKSSQVCCLFTALPITRTVLPGGVPEPFLYSRVKDLLHSMHRFYHDSARCRSALVTAFMGLHLQPAMPSQVRGLRFCDCRLPSRTFSRDIQSKLSSSCSQ